MSIPSNPNLSSTQKLWILIFTVVIACWVAAGPLLDILDGLLSGSSVEEILVLYGYAPSPTPTQTPTPLQYNLTACLEGDGVLRFSVRFNQPVAGSMEFNISPPLGSSYFVPLSETAGFSESADGYSTTEEIASPVTQWVIELPTASMPVGQVLTGYIVFIPSSLEETPIGGEFSVTVEECVPTELLPPTETPTATPNPVVTPAIINSICLNSEQLMIVFEFQGLVTGLYEVIVDGVPYQLTPVPDQPNRLFFFGAAPPGGGMPEIVMRSLPDQVVVLEVTDYSVPQCDFESPNNPNPGGDYVPPP